VKKRLEEIHADNEMFNSKLKFREIQKLYNRLLSDTKNVSQWHDLSIEMLLNDPTGRLIRGHQQTEQWRTVFSSTRGNQVKDA